MTRAAPVRAAVPLSPAPGASEAVGRAALRFRKSMCARRNRLSPALSSVWKSHRPCRALQPTHQAASAGVVQS